MRKVRRRKTQRKTTLCLFPLAAGQDFIDHSEYGRRNLLSTPGMLLRVREMEKENVRTVMKTEEGNSGPRGGWNNKEKQSRAENERRKGTGGALTFFSSVLRYKEQVASP
ncbi:hypothetical protein ATANTOWER_017133 [Ataeniobius toweri]|uniref:Uncharacterized protein n=1 Tax=Ataeniobius toweri TaxID=208326 RepID=A0ABU7AVR3_9TELE|nr:hypothetical protein [Ataeniobius toweri]